MAGAWCPNSTDHPGPAPAERAGRGWCRSGGRCVIAGLGVLQPIEVYIAIGAASGGILGYLLSGFLVEADRTKVIGIAVGAGILVLSVAAFLIGVVAALRLIAAGEAGILSLPLALVTATLYPIVVAIFAQGVLAVSITGAAIWAAATHLMLRRMAGHTEQLARPSAG